MPFFRLRCWKEGRSFDRLSPNGEEISPLPFAPSEVEGPTERSRGHGDASTSLGTNGCFTRRTINHGATTSGRFGSAAWISGEYIASTRVGGSRKRPAPFTRTTYSAVVVPLGSQP